MLTLSRNISQQIISMLYRNSKKIWSRIYQNWTIKNIYAYPEWSAVRTSTYTLHQLRLLVKKTLKIRLNIHDRQGKPFWLKVPTVMLSRRLFWSKGSHTTFALLHFELDRILLHSFELEILVRNNPSKFILCFQL